MRNIAELRRGHFGGTSFMFFALVLLFVAMFISGVCYQYEIYKRKRGLLKFSYIDQTPDVYNSLNEPN